MTLSVQLVVTFADHSHRYFPLGRECGWKIDADARCLVIGQGIPRTYVPLDQVRSFSLERYALPDADPPPPDPDGERCPSCRHFTSEHNASGCWHSRGLDLATARCGCRVWYGKRDD